MKPEGNWSTSVFTCLGCCRFGLCSLFMKMVLPSGTQLIHKEVKIFKFKQKLFSSEIMLIL